MLQAAGAAIEVAATQSLRIPTSPPSAFRHLLVVECPPTVLLRSFVAADDLIVLVAVFVSDRVAFAVVALLLCPSFVPLLLRQFRRNHMMTTPPKSRFEGGRPPPSPPCRRAPPPPPAPAVERRLTEHACPVAQGRQFRRGGHARAPAPPPAATASWGGRRRRETEGGCRRARGAIDRRDRRRRRSPRPRTVGMASRSRAGGLGGGVGGDDDDPGGRSPTETPHRRPRRSSGTASESPHPPTPTTHPSRNPHPRSGHDAEIPRGRPARRGGGSCRALGSCPRSASMSLRRIADLKRVDIGPAGCRTNPQSSMMHVAFSHDE